VEVENTTNELDNSIVQVRLEQLNADGSAVKAVIVE
jgi:hypothetical protein